MATTTTTRRTADDIARLFAERQSAHGDYISVKQANWLSDHYRRERGRGWDPREEPTGTLCETFPTFWHLHRAQTGASMLRRQTCEHRPCTVAGCSCKQIPDVTRREEAVAALSRR